MVVVSLIDQIDDGCERRALTTAGWSSDQHETVFDIHYLFQLFRQIEIIEPRRPHWDNTHDDGVSATLLEDVDAESRITRNAERKVCGAALFKSLEWRWLIADDQLGNSRSVRRQQFFQTGDTNGH